MQIFIETETPVSITLRRSMESAAMRPLLGRPRRICSRSTTTGAGAEPLATVLWTEATQEVTNLRRHLRRVPTKEKEDGEKSGVDGEREGEGHCCKLAGRRIDIAMVVVVALGESEEVFYWTEEGRNCGQILITDSWCHFYATLKIIL